MEIIEIGKARRFLKKFSLILVIWLLPLDVVTAQKYRITELRSQGWLEISRHSEVKNLPGDYPYENLTRVIQMVHFVFEKDGIRQSCSIIYDSQRDQIHEDCNPQ